MQTNWILKRSLCENDLLMDHINQIYLALILFYLEFFLEVILIATSNDKELVFIDIQDFWERNIKICFQIWIKPLAQYCSRFKLRCAIFIWLNPRVINCVVRHVLNYEASRWDSLFNLFSISNCVKTIFAESMWNTLSTPDASDRIHVHVLKLLLLVSN